MITIPFLRHNKVEQVDVPTAHELYKKLGFGKTSAKYSGDVVLDPNQSKIDQVSEVAETAFEEPKED